MTAAARTGDAGGRGRPVLLAVAHGSRDPRHAATVRAVTGRLRRAVGGAGVRVETAFLELSAPHVGEVVDRLAADGAAEVTAVPLLLGRAYHARVDLPEVLRRCAARHPALRVRQAPALGPSPLLGGALRRRLAEAAGRARGAAPSAASAPGAATGLLLGWAGSRDPGAAAAVRELAAGLAGDAGGPVATAAASRAPGSVDAAAAALHAAGARRLLLARHVLAPGLLPDRLADTAARACLRHGMELCTADVLGAAPEVVELAVRRYEEGKATTPLISTDAASKAVCTAAVYP